MFELFLSGLERIASVQPQLTILILLLVFLGDELVSVLVNLMRVIL